MGLTLYNLSCEELCDLMCGKPEEDYDMAKGNSKLTQRGGNNLAGVNTDEQQFAKENKRVEEFMQKPLDGHDVVNIEMDNGQVLEHYSMDMMKNTVLKEAKDNKEVWEDDAIYIKYKDGKVASYTGGDDVSKMKLTNIEGAIYSNAGTTAYAGKGVKIRNYNEIYDDWGFDDWRMEF